MGFGPDFNLSYIPAGHVSIALSGYTRLQFGGNGANEQGLVIYNPALTVYYAILRSPPGIDDANGALLRAGTHVLVPGTYVFGGYCKVPVAGTPEWRTSRAGALASGNGRVRVGWDDIIRFRESGLPEVDNDFDDLVIELSTVSMRIADGPDRATGPVHRENWSVELKDLDYKVDSAEERTDGMTTRRLVMGIAGGTDPIGI